MTARIARWRSAAAARPGVVLALLAAVLVLGAVATLLLSLGGTPERAAAPGDDVAEASRTAEEPSSTMTAAERTRAAVAALPTSSDGRRLHVPALGIDAAVVPVPLEDGGVLDPPADVSDVGWWDGSAEPGAEVGQTVMAGHTVHDGGGVMDDLEDVRTGDVVRVTDTDGHVDYRVTEVTTWSTGELAERAVEAFGQDRHHGRLVLVTCEDWVGEDYTSNVVVFAEPLAAT